MSPIIRNFLAVIGGVAAGSIFNMGLVQLGHSIVPPPEGVDVSTAEGLREGMELFKPINFLFPFLAHALGTLVGAAVAAKLAASHQMKFAMGIGVFFLLGGIMAVMMFGGPLWFKVVDLVLAYVPMGYLGGMLGGTQKG